MRHHGIFNARPFYYGCIIISQTKVTAYLTNKLNGSSSELFKFTVKTQESYQLQYVYFNFKGSNCLTFVLLLWRLIVKPSVFKCLGTISFTK